VSDSEADGNLLEAAENFDPTTMNRVEDHIDSSEDFDNPYTQFASINLEEASRAAEFEDQVRADSSFAKTTLPDSGIFDENSVNFRLESGAGE